MAKKYIAGIDPGTFGAICLYAPELPLIIYDMPLLKITRNGKEKNQIDLYELSRWIDCQSEYIEKAFIENPLGMPGQSSTSTFRLGFNCGVIQGIVAANFIGMELISPQRWKKFLGLSKDKDASRLKASQIAPNEAHNWSRVKDDGRSEAFLIAYYGSQLLAPTIMAPATSA